MQGGFEQYEISNFCRPGYECRHNLIYWECDSYIGFGSGAHSHIKGENGSPWGKRWGNIRNPDRYMEAVNIDRKAHEFTEVLTKDESLTDKLIMGLRLRKGVDIEQIENRYDIEFDQDKLKNYIEDNMIEISDGKIKITDKGRIFSNELILKAVESFKFLN